MNRKQKRSTIGTYIVFTATLIPILFKEIGTIYWAILVGIGFVFLIGGNTIKPKIKRIRN